MVILSYTNLIKQINRLASAQNFAMVLCILIVINGTFDQNQML
ncbi:hypothetical protein AO366_1331 [Moraxella catarrhalis]|nr:hypothetical protein AO366_1331 [Moraxella catarrhalis]